MAATVEIIRKTGPGSSPVNSTITAINTRANAEDQHTVAGVINAVNRPLPTNPPKYSYWVSTRLMVTVTPAGTINNLRWFTDGSNGLGIGLSCSIAKASNGADDGYRQATGTLGDTGIELNQTNHDGLDEAPSDAFAFTSASPKSLGGSISNPDTGEVGDFVVYQIAVTDAASPGPSGQEQFSFRFDET